VGSVGLCDFGVDTLLPDARWRLSPAGLSFCDLKLQKAR